MPDSSGKTLGSQRLLQIAVNERPQVLEQALRAAGALGPRESVDWRSPLEREEHVEYRDQAALAKLDLGPDLTVPLKDFWPSRGAVWDALGVSSEGARVLVEAKAHIPEAASPGTKASPRSKELIERSLAQARRHYAPRSSAVWSGTFYQYANRLAYQFFLRDLNPVNSRLVFLDFTNASDMDGPESEDEWKGAVRLVHAVLGLPASLERFGVYHAYLDARHVTHAT